MADPGDLERLYRQQFDHFVRVAATVTGDMAAAHDAVQEGFARALRSLRKFRGDGPLEGWVWRIILNAAHDGRASAERATRAVPIERVADPEAGTSAFARWIEALPPRQRLVLFLRYEADLDYRTIAEALGVEVGTVSATLHAAHRSLRLSLEEAQP
jgi:RNA polymerase sigma-70 factor (ECF subfamily)